MLIYNLWLTGHRGTHVLRVEGRHTRAVDIDATLVQRGSDGAVGVMRVVVRPHDAVDCPTVRDHKPGKSSANRKNRASGPVYM